ncbi:MAG: PspC domain-containing protein [Chloroflexota bacterium]
MVRSFSNRLFGGVCGGFASTFPLNAWLWRLIFVILTLVTFGAGALWYLALWWILPLDSPLRTRDGSALTGFIGIILGIAFIGLWFSRNALGIAEAYWGIAFLILSLVFLLKQVFTGRSQNILIGLVLVAIPTVFLLQQYDVLQAGVEDILLRSAPALLVFFGLMIALRYRVKFASLIALIVSIALVAGLATFAFSSRVDVVSTDNQVTYLIPNSDDNDQATISDDITTLALTIDTADTAVTITANEQNDMIEANFVGSNNSEIDIIYSEDDGVSQVQIAEVQRSDFPLLQDIGRGELTIELPADLGIFLTFTAGQANTVSIDMGALELERLTFNVADGDVLVRLPNYNPQSPSVAESNGTWTVQNGSLQVLAPQDLGLRFAVNRSRNAEPSGFDDLIYQLLLEGDNFVLASRQFDNVEQQMQFNVDVSGGRFTLDNADG